MNRITGLPLGEFHFLLYGGDVILDACSYTKSMIGNTRRVTNSIKYAFVSLWRSYRWYIAGAVSIHLIEAVLPLVHIYLAKELIDSLVAFIQHEIPPNRLVAKAILLLAVQIGMSLLNIMLKHVNTILMTKFNHYVMYKFDKGVLQKCNALSLVYFDISEFHNTIMRATNGIGNKMVEMLLGGLRIGKSLITLVGFLYVFYSVHWGLFVLIVLMFLPTLAVNLWGSNMKYSQNKSRTLHSRRLSYLHDILKNREAAKELRMFGHFHFLFDKWKKLFREDFKVKYSTEKKIIKLTIGVELSNMFVSTVLVACFFWLFYLRELTVGEYSSYTMIIFQIFSIFQSLSFQFGSMYTNSMHIDDYKQFMELKEEDNRVTSSSNVTFPLKEGISLRNVSFSYPNQRREVLSDISFSIKPGEKIAIVGDNGAGKSTLIKCLVGLYPITGGEIVYDQVNIEQIAYSELRSKISLIFQDFVKYDLTVKENIGLSDWNEMDNAIRMKQVSERTGLEQTIHRLPDGFETELGYTFQTGRTLSGGEWQKIAISRALFKNSEIVILDEPTAALDPIAESRLLEKFVNIIDNKTGIVISHRLGICRFVDRVIVLQEGRLVEEGSHEELVAKNGVYACMYSAQSKWYADRSIAQHS